MVLLTPLVVWTCPWWRYQMETFSALLAFLRVIQLPPVNSPHKGQWRGALMFSTICASINGWVKMVRLVIWDAITLIMTSIWCDRSFFFFLWSTYPAGIWLCMVTTMTVKWTWNTCMSMIKWNVDWMHSYCDALCENTQVLCSGLIYLPLKNCPFYDP